MFGSHLRARGNSDVMLGVGIFKNNKFSHQHRIPHAEISQNTKFQLLVPFPRGVIVIGYFWVHRGAMTSCWGSEYSK